MRTLIIGGCVCALLGLVVFPAVFVLLAMTMGVAVLAKGKVEQGIAVILLAGGCGYYAMASWKPLDGFREQSPVVSLIEAAPQLPAGGNQWRVVSLQARVSNNHDAGPVCDWKLVVRNESLQPKVFHGQVQFQDTHGVTVLAGQVNGYQVPAGTLGVFTGSTPIKNGIKLARVVPQISEGS
jgi:hypothetical protein